MTTQLQATNFCDIGTLTNATNDERITIIALATYNRLGIFDPSNEYFQNYKNKDILDKYKKISEERLTKMNTLLKIYDIIQKIETRVEQLTTKNRSKGKNKNK